MLPSLCVRMRQVYNVPLAGEEENVVVRPERHQHAARLADCRHLDVAERDLAVAHLAETYRCEAVLVAELIYTRTLDALR